MSVIILKPNGCEAAYMHAAGVFCDLYFKGTGQRLEITDTDDKKSDLIVIGSDAVNDYVMNEMLALRLGSLGIRYGTDDYCIRSYRDGARKVLILAGGRGRSTLYAVYDYFERYLGCHYFWDGDVIPHSDAVPMTDINVCESARFEYRGLRYFAHRGLKRFQAEHWSFEDWKRELDWLVKKRLNFFMLRIGMDDVWQRAFPDDVRYPDGFNEVTGIDAEGYNDRTDFWSLKYRGKLREKVLEYARELDLTYPVDCGTMTHWYSRTPSDFLQNKSPEFLGQEEARYTDSDSGRVFDITKKENMDYYMQLTKTMVDEYEKSSALFHTIGLGERNMFKDKQKNHALKLLVYRRIAQSIRETYPDSKLMLASWDFVGWWKPDEVQSLVSELDPERTLILDYTSEVNDEESGFMNWGVVGKFPWIFGLFHAYESESELRGPYDRIEKRLKIAADDPYCKGMILWPELSHSDPLVLEYLSENAWSPLESSIEQITERFCKNRYGSFAQQMNYCWQNLLPFIKLNDWGGYSTRTPDDEKFIECLGSWFVHQDIWAKPLSLLERNREKRNNIVRYFCRKAEKIRPIFKSVTDAISHLSSNASAFENTFVLRDAVDMTRTVIGRMLSFIFIRALEADGDRAKIGKFKEIYFQGLDIMQRLLSVNDDFSMLGTLRYIQSVTDTNPQFEVVLKRNIGNRYCSQPAYELVRTLIKDESEAAFDALLCGKVGDGNDFSGIFNGLFERFENIPLEDMQPKSVPAPQDIILEAAEFIRENDFII